MRLKDHIIPENRKPWSPADILCASEFASQACAWHH